MPDRVTSVRLPVEVWERIDAALPVGKSRNGWIRETLEAALPDAAPVESSQEISMPTAGRELSYAERLRARGI